jgi:hypothetical protein
VLGEVRFGGRFGVEFGSLYHRLHLSGSARAVNIFPQWSIQASGGAFDIPLSVKYRLRRTGSTPFFAAGPAFRVTDSREN